jgi:hypothetical protein
MGLKASLLQAPRRFCSFVLQMCDASIASINNFKNATVASIRQGYTSDPRPHLILEVDGQDIGFLYDSDTQVNTIAKTLYDQYFSNPVPVIDPKGAHPSWGPV